ncbi:4-phosphoerythronate dehydrogenase [Thiomicrorhabdus heinhorstiae]|uniref:Erythronate-4-phosphate dehydrogenase n=1 Tax=Thiomicrorhabdus heinhorstiae TaxID=2748010 RepID=A0ABS0BWM7_9GAMM|nr:4-phosphoerythronate dehydrogenase [Thiomicrorhabdus heinhorstiae]MBF6058189.1 4-phosphoerythronate dehydrogenase [Thiomicrorhabdus heinhorstiae]
MPTRQIVIDDAVPYAADMFGHLGEITLLPGKKITPSDVQNADALIVRSRTQVNQNLLTNSRVQFVGSTVVGLDHIDQTYLQKNDIHFYSAQGCNANSVAEYVIHVLFDLAERHGFDLQHKTLGIIGVGNVGGRLYQKAQNLGIKCLLNDPPRERDPKDNELNFVDLDQCLTADIITVHTPLYMSGVDCTYNLINAEHISRLSPEQILINAARGGIINEAAWAAQPLQAIVVDCWENEPNIDETLYRSADLATPHIAGHSLEAKIAGGEMVYRQLCRHWQIEPQNNWQTLLPPDPQPIEIDSRTESSQTKLHRLFKEVYNPYNDDSAIRDKQIQKVHLAFEDYRRTYPLRREWHRHRVQNIKTPHLAKLLKSLKFIIDG